MMSIPALCPKTSWQQLFLGLTFPKGGQSSAAAALLRLAAGKWIFFPLSPYSCDVTRKNGAHMETLMIRGSEQARKG